MKKALTFLALMLISLSVPITNAATPNDITGNWTGMLEVGQIKLRLVFRISKSASGGLTAKMDSPDQGARDIPVEVVTLKENILRIEVKSIQGLYEGTLNAAGKAANGQWKQGQNSLPLNLIKGSGGEVEAEKLSPADLTASKLAAQKLAGTWNGTLVAGAANLRLRLNITKAATGAATGTMDSLDQGVNGIPISSITQKDGKIRMEIRGIGVIYEGMLTDNDATVTGQWQQGGQSLPLTLKKAAKP
jgi:hypothetical protein